MSALHESGQAVPDTSEKSNRHEDRKPETEFPEGGARAWLVVLGAFCVSFSTFGYMNAFGYALIHRVTKLANITSQSVPRVLHQIHFATRNTVQYFLDWVCANLLFVLW